MSARLHLMLSVYPTSDAEAVRAMEVLTRAAVGVALDGMEALITVGPDTPPEETGGETP